MNKRTVLSQLYNPRAKTWRRRRRDAWAVQQLRSYLETIAVGVPLSRDGQIWGHPRHQTVAFKLDEAMQIAVSAYFDEDDGFIRYKTELRNIYGMDPQKWLHSNSRAEVLQWVMARIDEHAADDPTDSQ